ncbi:hypothetical protein ACVU7I_09935 [Patulibacter sp. S7RM1-6]
MTTLFPEFSDELARAAERAVAPRRPRWLSFLAAFLGMVAVAGVATAATGLWRPLVGDADRGRPTLSASPVPRGQLRHLGVLRRPAAPADRGADVRAVLGLVGRSFRGVRTDAVRRVGGPSRDGAVGAQILIPAVRANGVDDALCLYVVDRSDGAGSTCFTTKQVLGGDATFFVVRERPLPAGVRARDRRAHADAMRRSQARQRAVRRKLGPLPTDPRAREVALARAYERAGVAGTIVRSSVPAAIDTRFFGLVPDGVARVVRRGRTGNHAATVHDNAFQLVVPGRVEDLGRVSWLDAAGRTVREIRP